MANLTGGTTIGIDMFEWQDWGFDQFQSSSTSHYEYLSHNGNTVRVSGTDFSFDEDGYPVKGTVNQLEIFDDNGNQIASLVLGNAPLGELAANDFNSLWEVLLQGDDTIFTGHQADYIAAYGGDDIAWGGGGDDNIFGGDGDDILNGEKGNDTVFGDAGDDTIIFNPDQGNDRIYGGEGADTVVTHGVQSELGDIVEIERIAAKDVDPQGPGSLTSRKELPPEPHIRSKTSDDAAIKEFTAAPAPKGSSDGVANKEFAAAPDPKASEDYNVRLEVGTSTGGTTGLEVERTEAIISGVETLEVRTGDHNDNLHVDALGGTALGDGRIVYEGGAGDDDLFAEETATAITYVWQFEEGEGHPGGGLVRFGSSDQDTVHLVDNADEGITVTLDLTNFTDTFQIISGVTGAPFSQGLSVFNVENVDLDFGAGNDRVIVNEDLAEGYDGIIDIEFGDGENLLDVYGHNGRVEAVGGNDNNSYYSGGGDDLLIGGADHDEIFGGTGDDEIFGGGSFDEIGGGAGNDHIWGGAEGDRFSFEQGSGTDTIYDFVAGDSGGDVLDFLSLDTSQDQLQISQVGQHTHITTEFGDTVILQNVTATDLNSGDFLF